MKKGYDLIVSADGTAVAASKSCTIEISCDTKEVGMKGTGAWKRYLAHRKSWEVSTSFLVGDASTIRERVLQVSKTVKLQWSTRGSETDTMSGSAIVTACKVSGIVGNLVQGSFTFKGTGELK